MTRKWNYQVALASAAAETAALIEGGFRLCAYGVLAYIDGVYWNENRVPAETIREQFFSLCDAASYSKSSKYEYAKAAMRLAANMVKRFGHPNAKERNAAWEMLANAETVNEACDMVVSYIKTDYGVSTMRDLFAVLSGNKPAKPVKPLAETVVKAVAKKLENGEATANDVMATVVAMVDQFLTPDQLAELLQKLTDRMTLAGQTKTKTKTRKAA